MSREYECYCHRCFSHTVRKGLLFDNGVKTKYQCQCMNCGVNFIEITTTEYITLNTKGTDEKAWKKALREMVK